MNNEYWCTADGTVQSPATLLEYSRLRYPGVPAVLTNSIEESDKKYYLKTSLSEQHWTPVEAAANERAECSVVCQSGQLTK